MLVRVAFLLVLIGVLAGCGGSGTHSQTILITPVDAEKATASTP